MLGSRSGRKEEAMSTQSTKLQREGLTEWDVVKIVFAVLAVLAALVGAVVTVVR